MGQLGWVKNTAIRHTKALVIGILGTLSAAAIPIWQIYFVDVSNLETSIGAIRLIHPSDIQVSLDTAPLDLLEPYIPEELRYKYDQQGHRADKLEYPKFKLSQLDQAYQLAQAELLDQSDTNAKLQSHIKTINEFLSPTDLEHRLTEFRVSTLRSWNLSNYIDDIEANYYQQQVLKLTRDYATLHFTKHGQPLIHQTALAFLLQDLKEDLQDATRQTNHRLNLLRDNIHNIGSQLARIKQQQLTDNSYFEIEQIVSNVGRASTSFQPQAMLRVSFGGANHENIRLSMRDYQRNAEIPAATTRLISYHSAALKELQPSERRLLLALWGTRGDARLLTMDTQGTIYITPPKAFLDNQDNKQLLDQLKAVANKKGI
ncbi:MAG: hypothetical protein CENE_01183 [Candidatus Celerinatantimonas neptuna]|nr:MAG: hypothetical protein CENE_01183 [Candidatus Celerinatantimonas neptuna]